MSKPLGTLPKLPRTLVDDTEEVSWALGIARDLAKGKDFQAALVWLRRAAQSAAIAESDDRAVELADAAKLLGGWLRNAEPEPASGRTRTGSAKKKAESHLTRRSSTRTRRMVGLRPGMSVPPAVAKPSLPPKTTSAKPPSQNKSVRPTAAMKPKSVAPAKIAATKSIAPAAVSKTTKPRSIAPAPLAAAKKSVRPPVPVAAKKSVRPPAPVPVAAKKSVRPPAMAAPEPTRTSEAPGRKSMRPPQRTLLFSDMLPTANDPDDALAQDAVRAIPSLAKLSKGMKLALGHSAEILRPASGDEISITGLLYVAHGEVQVSAAVSDTAPVTLDRGAALRGQSSLGVPLALRCIAQGEGVVLLRWSVGDLAEALIESRGVDDELRELADPVQAACGAALGQFAEDIGEDTLRTVLQKMQLKRLAPGEVWVERGAEMPGVCVIGLGELKAADLRDYGPGDIPFAESALACEPLDVALTAGNKGALLWVGTRAALFELLTSAPTLLESLTQS